MPRRFSLEKPYHPVSSTKPLEFLLALIKLYFHV